MDMFTNNTAIYLTVVDTYNDIRLYKIYSTGAVYMGFPKTITTDGQFPSITGSNDRLYISYLSEDSIKTKYSSDNGDNWTQLNFAQPASGNDCNGVDNRYQSGYGLHITWATRDWQSLYETYYFSYDGDNQYNGDYKNVTDTPLGAGGFSSVDFATDRVFVGYSVTSQQYPSVNYYGSAYDRDRYSSIWNLWHPMADNVGLCRIKTYDNHLYGFYFLRQTTPIPVHYNLKLKYRGFTDINYSTTSLNISTVNVNSGLGITVTEDDLLNFAYDDNPNLYYMNYDAKSFSTPETITTDNLQANTNFGFNSVSNDIYVFWKKNNYAYLQFRQLDAPPLTPSGFAGDVYQNHPRVTWDRLEPDIQYFEIWRKLDGYPWVLYTTTNNNYYVDNGVQIGSLETGTVNYKVRSRDMGNHLSGYTNEVSFGYYGLNKTNVYNNSTSFELSANYPNPFNPSTTIHFTIKERSFVILKVYDLLGKEVSELANSELESGSYNIIFNASNLTSGVYIYSIRAMKGDETLFREVKQMMLLK